MRHGARGLILAVSVAACARGPAEFSPVPVLGEGEHAYTVVLIGDAGGPVSADAVLRALKDDVEDVNDSTTIVFLGDNIYPRGLPAPEMPDYEEKLERLERQVKAVTDAEARGIFVPGNHDWDRSGPDGFNAIRRQAEAVQKAGDGRVEFLPPNGCPGPEVRDVSHFRLVLLDTEWLLRDGPKGREGCAASTDSAVAAQLQAAVEGAGDRHVVVAAHHPLRSGGEHGGYFRVRDHLFPLRAVKSWLWFPLPVIGSTYPIARSSGASPQDISHSRNRTMRLLIERAIRGRRPLVYAAGHEHNLQVLTGTASRWLLVSGSGYYGHGGYVTWLDGTRYATSASGYMRLDATRDGRVRLSVLSVNYEGQSRETFSLWLTEGVPDVPCAEPSEDCNRRR